MPRDEERALALACRWLENAGGATAGTVEQIDRLFGLWACAAGLSFGRRYVARFQKRARALAPFEWFREIGDPLYALTVYRAMRSLGMEHASLRDLNEGYCQILREDKLARSSLGMIADVLRANGGDPGRAERRPLCMPEVSTLVTGGRAVAIEFSRDILMSSRDGLRTAGNEAASVLPNVAFSYARDWDLSCTCAVLRGCAYLGCAQEPAARWATQWLLDQQRPEGGFGVPLYVANPQRIQSSLLDGTIDAVWTIAELNSTGFLRG